MKKGVLLFCFAALLVMSSCVGSNDTPVGVNVGEVTNTEASVGKENTDSTDNSNIEDETITNPVDIGSDKAQSDAANDKDGKNDGEDPDVQGTSDEKSSEERICPEFSDDRWIIKPAYTFDTLETFGMSGYSIYTKDGEYGILDMSANGIGTGDYSRLFYCPVHGLSCPDILEVPIQMRDDLYLAPDCGYEYDPESRVVYVFDPTRDRVYACGYSDGYFRIVDITETEFFKTNERYTVVLYDCDADLMMYEGIGMPNIETVFAMENKEMHYGVIDTDMDYVIACIYDEVLDGNDCYIVKKDGKYGYRALTGREYYPCVFEEANTAYKGAAWVKYGGIWGTVRF